jgi:transposase
VSYNFLPMERSQEALLPTNMWEWLPRDHFAYFVAEFVDGLDMAPFHVKYRHDGRGGAAYNPRMMVALLVYAYCRATRSSRAIEDRCQTDIAYRFITCGYTPDHSTIARFRDRFEAELKTIFVPVLALCLGSGLGDTALAAIDGSKFRAAASLRANRTRAQIEKELEAITEEIETELARIFTEMLADSRRADIADDTLPGMPPSPPRGPGTLPDLKGLPKSLHGKASRRGRLARAQQALDDERAAEQDNFLARMTERGAQIIATGKAPRGRRPKPPEPDPRAKVNVTDPESRIMKDAHGELYYNGYNAQATVLGGIVAATAHVVNDQNDAHLLHPMIAATEEVLAAAGVPGSVRTYLLDTGYRNAESVAGIVDDGPTVLMPAKKERVAREDAAQPSAHPDGMPPAGLGKAERIDWLLDTPWGKETYKKRSQTVEPVFGLLKNDWEITRFLRVGLSAVDSEWNLMVAAVNLRKIFRYGRSGTINVSLPFFQRISSPAFA